MDLTTPRLRLDPFQQVDITEPYLSWLNDPEVTRFSNQRFRQHTAESSDVARLGARVVEALGTSRFAVGAAVGVRLGAQHIVD